MSLVTPARGTLRRISFHFQLWLLLCSFTCRSVHLPVHPPMHPLIHESYPCTHPPPIPPFILPHPPIYQLSTHPSVLLLVLRLRSKIVYILGEGRDQPWHSVTNVDTSRSRYDRKMLAPWRLARVLREYLCSRQVLCELQKGHFLHVLSVGDWEHRVHVR